MVEEIFLDPNVAYVLLMAGFLMAILAVLTPGTGLFEIGALFAWLLAGWGIYNLPINTWALVILVIGVFPFLLAVRKSGQLVYLGSSIVALVIGSAFLFRGEDWRPAVNPFLALVVSTFTSGYFWIATRKILEAEQIQPRHDLEALIGAVGEARTDIHEEGSVQVMGELWTASSEGPIPGGSEVRVVGREGFVLEVERVESENA